MFGGPIKVPPKPCRRGGNREPVGQYPFQYGQVVREPNTDWSARSLQARQRARARSEEQRAALRKAQMGAVRRVDFEVATDRRLLLARARAQLSLALRAVDADLDRRRARLREFLRCEDAALTAELVRRAQLEPVERLQRAQEEQLQLRARREEQRREEAEKLRQMQYRDRCQELRDLNHKSINMQTRDSQLYQMHEKKWLRHKQKEEDNFWVEVIKKNEEAMAAREEAEARAEKARCLDAARDHLAQTAAAHGTATEERLRARTEAALFNELVAQQMQSEKAHDGEELRRKQEQLRKDLDAQQAQTRALRAAVEEAERRFDLAAALHARAEAEHDDAVLQRRKGLERHELMLYRDYKVEEKRMIGEEEQRVEERRNELAMVANLEREKRSCELKEAHNRLEEETRQGLRAQLEQRRERAKAEAEAEAEERLRAQEIRKQHVALQEEAAALEAERQRRYRCDLVEQQRYTELLKERERALEQERLERERLEEQQLQQQAQRLLETRHEAKGHPLRALALREPPPDVAPAMNAPGEPLKPCPQDKQRGRQSPLGSVVPLELESQRVPLPVLGVKAALERAVAAATRPAPRKNRSATAGVEQCDDCGGVRVQPDTLAGGGRKGSEPCQDGPYPPKQSELPPQAGATVMGTATPKGGVPYNGLGDAAAAMRRKLPEPAFNCHAPPTATPFLPGADACADQAPQKSTGRVRISMPAEDCYMAH